MSNETWWIFYDFLILYMRITIGITIYSRHNTYLFEQREEKKGGEKTKREVE